MAAASQQPLFEDLMRDIAHQRFKPVYLLMGAENYYIDCLVDAIIKNALTEMSRLLIFQCTMGWIRIWPT